MSNFKCQNHQAAHPKMIAPVAGCPDLMVSDMTQEIGFVESIKEGASPNYEQHPLGSLLQLVRYTSHYTGPFTTRIVAYIGIT